MRLVSISMMVLLGSACTPGLLELEEGDWRYQVTPIDDACGAQGSFSTANGSDPQPQRVGMGATVGLPISNQPLCFVDGIDLYCPEELSFHTSGYDNGATLRLFTETRGSFSRDGTRLEATIEIAGRCYEGADVGYGHCPAVKNEVVVPDPCVSTFSLTGTGPSGRESLPEAGQHASCQSDATAISTFTDNTPTVTTITNASSTVLSVFWIDTTGVAVHLGEIYDDSFLDVNGFVGYVFQIRSRDTDACVRIHTVTGVTESIAIGEAG